MPNFTLHRIPFGLEILTAVWIISLFQPLMFLFILNRTIAASVVNEELGKTTCVNTWAWKKSNIWEKITQIFAGTKEIGL